MPGKVTLVVTAGPIQGARFEFTGHDTFLFGRAPDCHARLASADTSASRHHFLLEVNPPAARLRDLGSLNGTHVNGTRHGGRRRHESPEAGARRPAPEVDLEDGDRIRVGATHLAVNVEGPALCCECGGEVAEDERGAAAWLARTFLCAACRRRTGATARSAAPAPPAPAPEPPLPSTEPPRGPRLAGYELGPLLGRGPTGAVYRARRVADGAQVAIKRLRPQAAAGPEARAAVLGVLAISRALRHPGLVEVFDHGEDGQGFFVAMEYCPGGSLGSRVRTEGPLPVAAVAPLALQALEGLAFAHAEGAVHRDLKPENVLVGGDGAARVADFGFARSLDENGLSGLSATAAGAETLAFVPRERLSGFRRLLPASDVWSMGATIYHALTGRSPRDFTPGKDPMAVVLRGGIVPLRRRAPHLPAVLAAVVDRAVADDPEARYPTAGELRDALRGALD